MKKYFVDKSAYQKTVNECTELWMFLQDFVTRDISAMKKKLIIPEKYRAIFQDSVLQKNIAENCDKVWNVFPEKLA